MYKFAIKCMKFLTSVCRFIQVLGVLYLILFGIFWLMQVGQVKAVPQFAEYFSYLEPATDWVEQAFNITQNEDYRFFHFHTIITIILNVMAFLLFNFVFIIISKIEEILIVKAYRVGEIEDTELSS